MNQPNTLPTAKEGLVLRPLGPDDEQLYADTFRENLEFIQSFGSIDTSKYLTSQAVRMERQTAERTGASMYAGWQDNELVGGMNLIPRGSRAELSGWLDQGHTGLGYATIAVRSLTEYAQSQLYTVFAMVLRNHVASARVLQRAGFIQSGVYLADFPAGKEDRHKAGFLNRHGKPEVVCMYEAPAPVKTAG